MLKRISVKRLTIGLHVSLADVPWFNHPFLRSSFEIKSKSDIKDIAAMGRETVLYDPKKSTAAPLKADSDLRIEGSKQLFAEKSLEKSKKASELRRRRLKFQKMEKEFSKALSRSSDLMREIMNGHIRFCDEAKGIADGMARTFLEDVELCVKHINVSASDDGQQFHGLNVMVLSLMLGKQLDLNSQLMEKLAFGALVHDIGMQDLPKQVRIKPKLSKLELQKYQEHPRLGVTILSQMPDIDKDVMKIVYQHHETCAGSGYPRGLRQDDITELSKIVCIVDAYDRMINTRDPGVALSPHKALAVLWGKQKQFYDERCLGTFIKMLGVYPPGTVCRFTSGDIGVIMGVDASDTLHPEVIIYDASIPKHDAIIYKLGIDLDIEIESTLRPTDLDSEQFNYLNSRTNIQYYPSAKG